ncbi:MAG: hypothetical protein ACKVKP_00350 [Acidimicrobiales bacterium]|jgi:hypothetical protein
MVISLSVVGLPTVTALLIVKSRHTYRGSLIMDPVWHVEQSLTGSHTKVILVNAVAAAKPARVEVNGDSQKTRNIIRQWLFG